MKQLILCYSYSGQTKQKMEALARETGADLMEIKDVRPRGKVSAYASGSLQSMRGAASPIQPLSIDWTAYDRVTLAGPIWAGKPAPAVNSAADLIPSGMAVDVTLTSMSGNGNTDRLRERLEARGCKVGTIQCGRP
ncbi:hypothetical protein LJC74_09155 [Eubacteriales bacterium OttesenSCG-928-A19]|nr:hypothetical protein [Eubacteriales bacterium OttesenSCG-928-A19]